MSEDSNNDNSGQPNLDRHDRVRAVADALKSQRAKTGRASSRPSTSEESAAPGRGPASEAALGDGLPGEAPRTLADICGDRFRTEWKPDPRDRQELFVSVLSAVADVRYRGQLFLELIQQDLILAAEHCPSEPQLPYKPLLARVVPPTRARELGLDVSAAIRAQLGCLKRRSLDAVLEQVRAGAEVTFGPYRLRALLGQGTYGHVYAASRSARNLPAGSAPHRPLRTFECVVKIFRALPSVVLLDEIISSIEARTLRHPHIVGVQDGGVQDGLPFIEMEAADSDLAVLLRQQGSLEPRLAIRLLVGVAEALASLHAQGRLHRDIKPQNLLIFEHGSRDPLDWRLKLADFSHLAILDPDVGGYVQREGEVSGTAGYAAPEQSRPGVLTDRADVYGLATVLWEALGGRRAGWTSHNDDPSRRSPHSPDHSGSVLATAQPFPPVRSRLPDGVPEVLAEVLERCLSVEPRHRMTAAQFAAALRAVLNEQPVPGVTGLWGRVRYRLWSYRDLLLGAALALLVAISVLAMLVMLGRLRLEWIGHH